jgi:hypothetical protein
MDADRFDIVRHWLYDARSRRRLTRSLAALTRLWRTPTWMVNASMS